MADTPKKTRIVTQPYLTGAPLDRDTPKAALWFFGGHLLMLLLFMLISALMVIEIPFLRTLICTAAQLGAWFIFYLAGQGRGSTTVSRSEQLYDRRESGRTMYPAEERTCYHPLKGFILAFIGSVPLIACACALALMAQKQGTGFGSLPSWVAAYEGRDEIGQALLYYHEGGGLTAEDLLRVLIRMLTIPFVGIIGSDNADAMLMLERLSPVILLIPAVCYGIGFTRGPAIRTALHTKIAANNRRRARKEKREVEKRRASTRKPEELN